MLYRRSIPKTLTRLFKLRLRDTDVVGRLLSSYCICGPHDAENQT